MTYKNIRIKVGKKLKGKDTRKSRLQRVKVLASGKFKFVKNLTKSKSRPKAKTKTTRRKKRSNPKKGGNKRMGKSLVQSVTKLAKAGSLLTPIALAVTSPGDARHKVVMYLSYVSGVDVGGSTAQFKLDRLLVGWGPYVGVNVASKVASKINGLISRI